MSYINLISVDSRIVDDFGTPLQGVRIVELSDVYGGANTDLNGYFSLMVSRSERLEISHPSYENQTFIASEFPSLVVMQKKGSVPTSDNSFDLNTHLILFVVFSILYASGIIKKPKKNKL